MEGMPQLHSSEKKSSLMKYEVYAGNIVPTLNPANALP